MRGKRGGGRREKERKEGRKKREGGVPKPDP